MDEKSPASYSNMKVADLKRELKSHGLPTTGNKKELLERLGATSTLESDDSIDCNTAEEDAINSEVDDVIADESELLEESALSDVGADASLDIDHSLLEKDLTIPDCKPPTPTPDVRPPSPHETKPPDTKKISLNRDVIPSVLSNKENLEKPAAKTTVKINLPSNTEEKLKDRASRFGLTCKDMSAEQRKKIRSERFSSSSISSVPSNNIHIAGSNTQKSVTSTDADIKRRQERFGVVSPESSTKRSFPSGGADEAKQKRLQRFGGSSIVTGGSSIVTPTNASQDEKKKLRAQRFITI